jgi:hypothetical protein
VVSEEMARRAYLDILKSANKLYAGDGSGPRLTRRVRYGGGNDENLAECAC